MAKWEIKTEADYKATAQRLQHRILVAVDSLGEKTRQEAAEIGMECATEAAERAPHDTGNLKESVYVAVDDELAIPPNDTHGLALPVNRHPDALVSVEVGFTAPYAFVQHEHIEFEHPSVKRQKEGEAPPIGQAKFLETVVDENLPEWKERMRNAALSALRGET